MRRRRSRPSCPSYRSRPVVEGLESRHLLAVTYASYAVPTYTLPGYPGLTPRLVAPSSIAVGPDTNIWFTASDPEYGRLGWIGKVDRATGVVTEYPTPYGEFNNVGTDTTTPRSIVSGPQGDLWFIDYPSQIASIDPTSGTITEYPVPIPDAVLYGLAVGSDGNLWFTDMAHGQVGMFNPTTHASTEFTLPTASKTGVITAGPDGNLWFSAFLPASSIYAIGEINPTTDAITLSELPNINYKPISITSGPNGTVWFNEYVTSYPVFAVKLGSISTSTHAITQHAGGGSGGITTGPDGNLWYNEGLLAIYRPDAPPPVLGEFNPTDQTSASYPYPSGVTSANVGPTIVTGPDGNLWFTTNGYIVSAHINPVDQASLTGTVLDDPTGSGVADPGSFGSIKTAPPSILTVYLDLNHDGTLDSGDPTTTTDSLGNYSFNDVAPGTYTVRVVTYPGTHVTFPTSGSSQTVTVAAGQIATVANIGVVATSSLLPLSYGPAAFGTDVPDVQTAEVNGLYRIILGRAPDTAGGTNAVAYLKAGGSLSQLSGDLLVSEEYDIDTVQSFYHNYLDRAASPAEQATGVTFLEGGGTQDQLAATVFNSAEFSTLFSTDTAFARQLYIDILGRTPSATELAGVVNMLGTGTTRATVVDSIINSVESDQRAIGGMFALLFADFNYTPPASILTVKGLQAGYTQINIAVALFSTSGFITQANATVA